MSSLARLLSQVASTVLLGLLFAVVSPADAQSNQPPTISFDPVAVGQTSTRVVSANLSHMNSTLSLAAGTEYTISAPTCVADPNVGYDCTATLTFAPKYPGLLVDAVFALNSDGFPEVVTSITGTGTSPQLGFNFGSGATYSPSVNNPSAVAIGPDGAIYVSSVGDHVVYRYNSDGSNRTTIDFSGYGTITPGALAVDGSNSVYVADPVNNRVYVVTTNHIGILSGSTQVSDPVGVAVDTSHAVYIADAGSSRVLKLDSDGILSVLASDVSNLVGVALDSAGNVYYAQAGSVNTVYEIPAGGGTATAVGQSTFGTIQGIAVDAGGAVHLATSGGIVLLSHNLTTAYGFGSGGPVSVAVDAQGNIYEAEIPIPDDGFPGAVGILLRNTGITYLSSQVGGPNGSDRQSFTIENTGNTPLSFTSFAIDNGVFTVYPEATTCVVGTPLAPGSLCTLSIAFTPTAPQLYTGTLTVTSNSLNGTSTTSQYMLNGQTPQAFTTFTVSPNPSSSGQFVTFVASVSASLGSVTIDPTGTVDFINVNNNNAILGSGTLAAVANQGQQATFTTTALPTGSYNVRARYNGSSTVGGSLSDPTTVVVSGLATTTTLAVSASTIVHGQPETLTATIAAGATPALTGSVNFIAGSNVLATVPVTATSTGGTATYTTSTLGIGTQSITAYYSGDTNYAAGGSNAQQVIVQGASPTTLSLAVSSATVPYRSPVVLTATALNFSNAPLTTGQVFFCDLSTPFCNATYNLGTVQLNSLGVAVLRLAPGAIGAHPFVANLISTNTTSNATATQTVTVTGTYPTSAALTSSGAAGSYTLTGTVIGAGSTLPGPVGTVTFQDLTNTSNPTLGTAALGAATAGFTTAQPAGSPIAVGNAPYGVATGDFNGDGFPDVVTGNYYAGTVSVLLGNGDGTFKPQVTYAVGSLPERVLVADFNGDGKADLVVANTGSGSVGILLGNGDGTFQSQVTYAAGSPVGLGVMDLNNDGIADLAVGDYYNNTLSILLGNGDGTFHSAVTYATGGTPQTLAEGDFNGDGYVDIAVGNVSGGTISIFLGNGDGTFKPQVTYAVGGGPQGVQVGDFNGDQFEDLAVSNSADGTISILIGNGDGTFKPQVTYPVGVDPVGLVVADFNGDGIQDLSTGNTGTASTPDLTQSILLGNGDGTFQPQIKYKTGNFPYGEAAADFDGDGYPDLAIANFTDSTVTVLLSQVTATSTATLAGVAVGAPTGTHTVDLSYPATGNFGASVSPTIQLTSNGSTIASSATTLSIAPAAASAGQSVAFTVAVAGTTQATPVPTGTVTLASTGGGLGTTTITLGTTGAGSFATTQIPAGTYSVTATYSGDANYAPSVSAPQTLVISLASQTITFPAIPSHTIEDAPFALSATASSGLAVTYTLVSGPATISGNTVTLTAATGTVVIQASQAGNTTYAAAPSVTQSFTVSAAPVPTLTGITPSAIVTGSAATTVTLTGTNFNVVDVLKLNGSGTVATTFVSATTLTAVIPASALATAGTIQVAVNDLIGKTTSNALTITVSNTPAVVFTGPTTPPTSGQQPTLTFQLTNPYPVALTASFNLLFAPAVTPAVDDPAIQFASGGRNFTFTIAANSIVTPAIQLQAGTEAGTITVPVTLTAQGVDVTPASLAPVVIVIPPAAPVVNLVTMNSLNGGVNVVVTGYSNTREATQAKFHFTAAPGAELNTADFTANINPLFGTWYGSAASAPYGSTVVYTQSFTLDSGTASTITGVTVTLTNSIGTSNTGTSQ